MPDNDTTTTTDTGDGGEGQSDKDKNMQALRERAERAEAKVAELEPKALREDVREAGFDPASDKGKVLTKDLARGEVKVEDGQELPEVLRKYAETEYQWKPPTSLSDTEQQQVTGQQRLDSLNGASTSEQGSGDLTTEYETKIAAAREAGDFALASQLQTEYERRTASRR